MRLLMLPTSTRVLWSQPEREGSASSASDVLRTDLVVLVGTVLSRRPLRTFSVKAETPAEILTFKRENDADQDGSAARKAALLTLQALCRLEDVSLPKTVSDALV